LLFIAETAKRWEGRDDLEEAIRAAGFELLPTTRRGDFLYLRGIKNLVLQQKLASNEAVFPSTGSVQDRFFLRVGKFTRVRGMGILGSSYPRS
jgi:hypothetical protein